MLNNKQLINNPNNLFTTFQSMAICVGVFDRVFFKLVRARLIHRAETHVDGFRVPQVFQGLAGQDGIKFCFAGFDIISIVFIICHEQFYGDTVTVSNLILTTDTPCTLTTLHETSVKSFKIK